MMKKDLQNNVGPSLSSSQYLHALLHDHQLAHVPYSFFCDEKQSGEFFFVFLSPCLSQFAFTLWTQIISSCSKSSSNRSRISFCAAIDSSVIGDFYACYMIAIRSPGWPWVILMRFYFIMRRKGASTPSRTYTSVPRRSGGLWSCEHWLYRRHFHLAKGENQRTS